MRMQLERLLAGNQYRTSEAIVLIKGLVLLVILFWGEPSLMDSVVGLIGRLG